MRILAIAAAFLIGGFVASGPAFARQTAPAYETGGPQQVEGWCKVISPSMFNTQQYGYYGRCPATAAVKAARASMAYAPRWHHRR